MNKRSRVALCTWCRAQLPDTGDWMQDAVEVQHHFFVAHNQPVDHSVRYVYTDDVEGEFCRWQAARVAAGVDGKDDTE